MQLLKPLLFKGAPLLAGVICCQFAFAQTPAKPANDATAPLHLLQPDYPVPYGETTQQSIKTVLDRIYTYLEATTPPALVSRKTGAVLKNQQQPEEEAILQRGDFRLISYEWGVTYAGMLLAAGATGDQRFADYTNKRLAFLANTTGYYRPLLQKDSSMASPVRSVLQPHALDDAGAMCAAMIKATRKGTQADLRPMIDNFINYISNKEFRLADGTLARNRPLPNTLWLDDLFMSVPALAQMGKLTGDNKYYDDAVKQVRQFASRMFNKEKGLFMHGWVQDMQPHPEFYWARANGWAVMTMAELLDVLPENYAGRSEVMELYKAHVKGLAFLQSGPGLWHQLLNREDSYLETSATAIYAYAIAKGINNGWLDAKAYGPMTLLAWSSVAQKVNDKGQVEGTCVGTGMGFDPAFYYYRPVNVYAAHGYGPVLLAGAEITTMLKKYNFKTNDSAVQLVAGN